MVKPILGAGSGERGFLVPEATRQTQWDPGLYADVNVFVLKEMAQIHNDFTPGPLAPEVTRLSCPISSSPDRGQGSLCEASQDFSIQVHLPGNKFC